MKKLIKKITLLLISSSILSQNAIADEYKFPEGFLWGTTTAAYQVEGGIKNDWSINKLDAGIASNHYKIYEEDFETAKKVLNNNTYRFSISWARIEPEKGVINKKEIEHYRNVLKSLKEKGLKPFVTLHHFTNPIWVAEMGGWENEEVIPYFIKFVELITKEFQQYVDDWITFNEPVVYAFKSYDAGAWPPYKKSREKALIVINNLIKAHGKAYHLIHKYDKKDSDNDKINAKVGFAKNITIMEPYFPLNPLDNLITHFMYQVFNEAFWEAIVSGKTDLNIPGVKRVKEEYDPKLKNTLDFIGVHYYTRMLVKANGDRNPKEGQPLNDLGWEIHPEGMLKMLKLADKYSKKLNIPIYITENGIADRSDRKRAKYIVTHLKKVHEAIEMGIDVRGYMHWTLMDNYEWAEEFHAKFGLMTIDRFIRSSAYIYADICKKNKISEELAEKYLKR